MTMMMIMIMITITIIIIITNDDDYYDYNDYDDDYLIILDIIHCNSLNCGNFSATLLRTVVCRPSVRLSVRPLPVLLSIHSSACPSDCCSSMSVNHSHRKVNRFMDETESSLLCPLLSLCLLLFSFPLHFSPLLSSLVSLYFLLFSTSLPTPFVLLLSPSISPFHSL